MRQPILVIKGFGSPLRTDSRLLSALICGFEDLVRQAWFCRRFKQAAINYVRKTTSSGVARSAGPAQVKAAFRPDSKGIINCASVR